MWNNFVSRKLAELLWQMAANIWSSANMCVYKAFALILTMHDLECAMQFSVKVCLHINLTSGVSLAII